MPIFGKYLTPAILKLILKKGKRYHKWNSLCTPKLGIVTKYKSTPISQGNTLKAQTHLKVGHLTPNDKKTDPTPHTHTHKKKTTPVSPPSMSPPLEVINYLLHINHSLLLVRRPCLSIYQD